jgi:hypothetical protein
VFAGVRNDMNNTSTTLHVMAVVSAGSILKRRILEQLAKEATLNEE